MRSFCRESPTLGTGNLVKRLHEIERRSVFNVAAVMLLLGLAACGGGGGGGTTAPVATPAPVPTLVPAPAPVVPASTAKSLSLIVGTADSPGSKDGTPLDASFNGPRALSVAADNTVYVADGCAASGWDGTLHALYRKISPNGQVTTVVGSSTYLNVGRVNSNSYYNLGADSFGGVCTWDITSLADGTLYASGKTNVVERISPQGQITTIAGAWSQKGAVDGSSGAARMSGGGVATDTQGNIYIGDASNHAIRKIDTSGNVTTYAGLLGAQGSADGALQTARFWSPGYLKFEKNSGKLYVADANGIRVIANGVVSTLIPKQQIYQDIYHASLSASFPLVADGLDVAANGRIAVTFSIFHRALIYRGNVLEVILGNDVVGDQDGSPSATNFFFPSGVGFISNGDLLISDVGNSNIKKYSLVTNAVSLYAGKRNFPNPIDGAGSAGKLFNAQCLVQSPSGDLWFSEGGYMVRRVDASGNLRSVSPISSVSNAGDAGCIVKANDDGSFVSVSFVNHDLQLRGPAGEVQRTLATSIGNGNYLAATNAAGDLFFSDGIGSTSVIRKYSNGTVSDFATVTGSGPIQGLTISSAGDFVVTNFSGIFKVSPAGAITSIAPAGPAGKYMDGAVGQVSLGIGFQGSPAVGSDGAIYIVSGIDSVIRKIYNGRVEKVVGTQWVNETTLGTGPGAIFDARALKYDAKTNSLIIMTGNAILRAQLP